MFNTYTYQITQPKSKLGSFEKGHSGKSGLDTEFCESGLDTEFCEQRIMHVQSTRGNTQASLPALQLLRGGFGVQGGACFHG